MNWGIKMVALAAIVQLGCNRRPASYGPAEYVSYVESGASHLSKVINSGAWVYRVQYKPYAYIALKEQSASAIDRKKFGERVKAMNHVLWFNVSLSTKDESADPLKYQARDINEYNSRLTYFLSHAAANFHLKYGTQGEMPQAAYYFENNYSIKPEVTAIVAFEIPDSLPKEDFVLEYDDELFNSGIIKAAFENRQLSALPSLNLN